MYDWVLRSQQQFRYLPEGTEAQAQWPIPVALRFGGQGAPETRKVSKKIMVGSLGFSESRAKS